ncbi:hypothetical protein HYC85_022370 [Camellia sinensis]|uniref:Serpin domain-containing protein n=1 Tax=Camellia sinensis TaxID=4442 RepID=A0A7J7GK95_CAMSI|nr:hypothetical protein HYC85_022370 [Camellia sinensis]
MATTIAFQNLDRERKLNTFFSERIGEREKDKHRPKSDLPSSSLPSLTDDTNGLPRQVKRLNSNPGFMNQEFELWEEEVPELWIPRFKFSFEFEASETIKEMGLELPFMDVGKLTEMVADGGEGDELGGGLYLSKVFHKSCIEVNEEGTEAGPA